MANITTGDGTTIAFEATGSGPAVFLLPGMSAPGATLGLPLAEPLVAGGHTVVTIDPRDTGASTRFDGSAIDLMAVLGGDFSTVPYTFVDLAGDALAVLDALGIDSATWVGYSMGGSVVAEAQAMAPDRVRGLVYFASAPGYGSPPTPEDLALVLRDAPTDRDAAVEWGVDFMRHMLGRHFDESTHRPDAERLVDEFSWWGVPVGHLAVGLVGLSAMTSPTPDESSTTIVFGDEDRVADGARALAATLPDASVVELTGFGHWLPATGPWPDVVQAILHAAAC